MGQSDGRRLLAAGAVGVAAGLASGLFGVGGGIVIVPALVALVGLDQRLAHGTSLTAIAPIALVGAAGYASGEEVDSLVAVLTTVGALAGAPLGVALLGRLPERRLRIGFVALLVASAVRLVLVTADGTGRGDVTLLLAALYLATGLVSGVLAGVMGVGGGIVMVPAFTILFGMPITLAKGTSLAVIAPTAVLGTVRNRQQGTTDLRVGVVVGLAGVLSAWLASQLSLGLDPRLSRVTFAGLILVAVGRMAVRLWRERYHGSTPRPDGTG